MNRLIALVPILVTAGCATTGGGAPSPPALEYHVPAQAEVTYRVTGVVTQEMDMMGNTQSMGGETEMTLAASFEESLNGVRVTLEVMEASADLAGAGSVIQADENDVDGPLVFEMTPTGDVSVEATPEVSDAGAEAFQFVGMAHTMFPHLPGYRIGVGDTWSGVRSYQEDLMGGLLDATTTSEYVVVRESSVDGESLLEVAWTGTTSMAVALSVEGMNLDLAIDVNGDGHFLWDVSAGLMIESRSTAEGLGSMNADMLPQPIPISMYSESHVELVRD